MSEFDRQFGYPGVGGESTQRMTVGEGDLANATPARLDDLQIDFHVSFDDIRALRPREAWLHLAYGRGTGKETMILGMAAVSRGVSGTKTTRYIDFLRTSPLDAHHGFSPESVQAALLHSVLTRIAAVARASMMDGQVRLLERTLEGRQVVGSPGWRLSSIYPPTPEVPPTAPPQTEQVDIGAARSAEPNNTPPPRPLSVLEQLQLGCNPDDALEGLVSYFGWLSARQLIDIRDREPGTPKGPRVRWAGGWPGRNPKH